MLSAAIVDAPPEDPATNDHQEVAAPVAQRPGRRNAAPAEVVAVATGEGQHDG
jgi:hypothetical protein